MQVFYLRIDNKITRSDERAIFFGMFKTTIQQNKLLLRLEIP